MTKKKPAKKASQKARKKASPSSLKKKRGSDDDESNEYHVKRVQGVQWINLVASADQQIKDKEADLKEAQGKVEKCVAEKNFPSATYDYWSSEVADLKVSITNLQHDKNRYTTAAENDQANMSTMSNKLSASIPVGGVKFTIGDFKQWPRRMNPPNVPDVVYSRRGIRPMNPEYIADVSKDFEVIVMYIKGCLEYKTLVGKPLTMNSKVAFSIWKTSRVLLTQGHMGEGKTRLIMELCNGLLDKQLDTDVVQVRFIRITFSENFEYFRPTSDTLVVTFMKNLLLFHGLQNQVVKKIQFSSESEALEKGMWFLRGKLQVEGYLDKKKRQCLVVCVDELLKMDIDGQATPDLLVAKLMRFQDETLATDTPTIFLFTSLTDLHTGKVVTTSFRRGSTTFYIPVLSSDLVKRNLLNMIPGLEERFSNDTAFVQLFLLCNNNPRLVFDGLANLDLKEQTTI